MYNRTAIYAAREDVRLEAVDEPDDARVWIRLGDVLTLWLDYRQAAALADQLIAQLPPETEANLGDQLELS